MSDEGWQCSKESQGIWAEDGAMSTCATTRAEKGNVTSHREKKTKFKKKILNVL